MYGKVQEFGIIEVISFICISAIWGQHPAFSLRAHQLTLEDWLLKNALHSIASTTREQKEWIIQKRQIKLNAYPERLEWYCSLTFTSIILSFSKPVSLMHTGLHATHTHTHSHIHTWVSPIL